MSGAPLKKCARNGYKWTWLPHRVASNGIKAFTILPLTVKVKRSKKDNGFTSDISLTAIHPTLQGFTFPSSACSLLSPSYLPGRIQRRYLSTCSWSFLQDYWAITISLLGANLSTAHKLDGWKAWVGLEVPRSQAWESETLPLCHTTSLKL